MCADELNIGLILPNIAAFSGGMERTLRLIENSAAASIRYTCLLPQDGVRNAEVARQLEHFASRGILDLMPLKSERGMERTFDAIAIPTEYWWGAWKRGRSAGLRGPYGFDFHQLPYIGTLDVLKSAGIRNPSLPDLVKVPALLQRMRADGFLPATVDTAASLVSIHALQRVNAGRVLAVTSVTAKNLRFLGFTAPLFVPPCPCGIARDPVEQTSESPAVPDFDAVYVGRLHPEKGFLDLPRIVASMRKKLGREPSVAVCGPADSERFSKRFTELMALFGVERNLHLLGRLPQPDLYRTIRRSAVLIYPSYVDAFSLTVLESLCLGVPVAAYDIDALEFIWGRRKGVYLAPTGNADAVASLACDIVEEPMLSDARQAARSESASLLEEYTWEGAVAGERKFYELVCED